MNIRRLFVFQAPDGDGTGGGGGGGIQAADARAFLGDFLPADTVKSMDDAAVLSHHKTFSTAIAKHAPKTNADDGKPWYEKLPDGPSKEWVRSFGKAYAEPAALVDKAFNLEKFVGADKAGRGIIVPKSDAKPEEWRAFWAKVGGVPEKPDGYKLPDKFKEHPSFKKFAEHAHKIGMPVQHFNAIMDYNVAEIEALTNAEDTAFTQRAEKELNEVKTEWGAQYDAKAEAGQRAARAFIPGTPEERQEMLDRMEGALGTKFMMNLWARVGEAIAEHGFVDGEGTVHGDGMTPEAARVEIANLKRDTAFAAKLAGGDAEAKAKWDKLHKVAFPGMTTL